MDFDAKYIAVLVYKSLSGELSTAEEAELQSWLNASASNRNFYDQLSLEQDIQAQAPEKLAGIRQELYDQIRMETGISAHLPGTAKVRILPKWSWIAAAILIGVTITATIWFNRPPKDTVPAVTNIHPDIQPATNKAILTLADGRRIELDSAVNGTLAQQGGTKVVKLANGQIAYAPEGKTGNEIFINTMTTPRSGQYRLTLPDGTNAWLNAASSITYPSTFTGKDRHVKISGEVYFEIAKNATKPFTVDVNGRSTIQVLGTSFNVNSYTNEGVIRTTLLEGSVKVNGLKIQPGQQTQQRAADLAVLSNVNTEDVMAWKNGFFNLQNADLGALMRELERWYDIDVRYTGNVPDIKFKGKLDRKVNLSDVLSYLSKLGVKTKIEGRTVTILE